MPKPSFYETQQLDEDLNIPITSRMAIILAQAKPFPNPMLRFMFIIQQAYIFLIIAKPTILIIRDQELGSSIIHNIYNFVFFEELELIIGSPNTIVTILAIIGIYSFGKILLMSYVFVILYRNKKLNGLVEKSYNALTSIHNLILFYPIHIFCIKVLYGSFWEWENMFPSQSMELFAKIFALMALAVNLAWPVLKMLLFTINIKTKDPLSTKTETLNLLDLAFTAIMPVVHLFILQNHSLTIVLLAANLVYCLLRDYLLSYYLPYYGLKTLKLATLSHVAITSFALAAIIAKPISDSRSYTQLQLLLPLWILFILVLGKVYTRYLAQTLLTILQHPSTIRNPYHLLHYLRVYKFYAESFYPGANTKIVKEKFLLYMSIVKQSEIAYLLPSEPYLRLEYQTQKQVDEHFMKYSIELLNASIKKNPKLLILRATLSHYYTKYLNLYVLGNQVLNGYTYSSFSCKNSSFLIKMIMVDKMRNENKANPLKVRKYIGLQERYMSMKSKITDQLEIGIQFWKQFQSSDCDFLSLTNLADQISIKSKVIKKTPREYQIFQEANYVEPLLIYSLYFYFGQNDLISAQKFFKEYCSLKLKNQSANEATTKKLSRKAFLGSEAFYFTLSTSHDHFGSITDCSGKALSVFGTAKEMLIRRQLSILMPRPYAKWYDHNLKALLTEPGSKILNSDREIPIFVNDGYIMPHNLQIALNWKSEFGLCFSGLLSPLKDDLNRVMIMEDGQILGMSREFAEQMNIQVSKDITSSIYTLCPSLEEITQNISGVNQTSLVSLQKSVSRNKRKSTIHFSLSQVPRGSIIAEETNILDRLVFYPRNYGKDKSDSGVGRNEKTVIYKAEIRKLMLQDILFFELKMEQASPNTTIQQLSLFAKEDLSPLSGQKSPTEATRFSQLLHSRTGKFEQEQIKIYLAGAEQINDSMSNYSPLLSPMSEGKKLFSISGDLDDQIDINSNGADSPKLANSMSFEKEINKIDDEQPAAEFMSISDGSSRASFSNMKRSDAYKATRQVINSRTYQRSSKAYYLCFIVTVIVQMVFLIWLNFNTSSTSKNVGILSQVTQSAYFRSYWTKIAIQDMLFWVAVRGNWLVYDINSLVTAFTEDFERISKYNQDLRTYLGLLDLDLQKPFYEKNVRVYERDNLDMLQLVSIDDTFAVASKIVNEGLRNVHKPEETFSNSNFVDRESKFIFDNGLNDFMVISESLTSFIQAKLFSTLQVSKKTMIGALYGTLGALILFVFVSLKFVISLNKDSTHFMSVMSTLKPEHVAMTENHLTILKEVLEKDSGEAEILEAFSGRSGSSLQKKVTYVAENVKGNRKILYRASMKKHSARNYTIFAGLFVCLGLMTGFMVIYYNQASDKISTMEKQHTNLNSALNFVNIFAYTIPQMQITALMNASTTVKNLPITTALNDSTSKLNKVSDFQASLQDSNGKIPDYQVEILYNYSCSNAYSEYYPWPLDIMEPECDSTSRGLHYVGLLNLLTQVQPVVNQFLWDLENGPRDIAGLNARFLNAFDLCNVTDITFILLLQSFAYSSETFENTVVDLEDQRVILAWVAIVLSLMLGTLTWIFIIKRLLDKEFEKKKMLALVSSKFILENLLLKKYVSKM